MSFKCPSGTKVGYRYKKGSNIRLGGCMRGNKFIMQGVKEAKDMTKYDPKQLKVGTKIEMEHTANKKVAEKIAKDHLREHPNYYTHFVKWEKTLKRKRK